MRSTLMRYTPHEARTHEVYAQEVSPRKMFRLRQVLILALDFSSPTDEPRTAIHSLAPTLL
jgi:hypothetical protein